MGTKGNARAMAAVRRAYARMVLDGYHRPNETIEDLEDALMALGMTERALNNAYESARRGDQAPASSSQ